MPAPRPPLARRRIQQAVATRVRELDQDADGRRTGAEHEARRIIQAAQEEAVRIKQAAEKELADGRAEARIITREAREQADALLREARAQADLASVESRALSEAVRDAQHRLRDLAARSPRSCRLPRRTSTTARR